MSNEQRRRRLPPGIALAWGATPERRRGPKPAHTLSEIMEVTLRLADQHGLTGLSMPRVAAEIGVTQNALYRYVASKEELLVLLADAGHRPPPELPSGGWRAAASTWTHALIDNYLGRPWLLDLPIKGAPRTPGPLRWVEALLGVLATETVLDERDQLRIVTMLDGYARGTGGLLRDLDTSTGSAAHPRDVLEFLTPRLLENGFPRVAMLMSKGDYDDASGVSTSEIEFGLQRILDGVEVMLDRLGDAR